MTTLDHFIEDLLHYASRRGLFREFLVGLDLFISVFLNYAVQRGRAKAISTDGLRLDLSGLGQGGQAWRHIRLHCACCLIGGPLGWGLSRYAARLDEAQARSGRKESIAEIAGNAAGWHCGTILQRYLRNELSVTETRRELNQTLAESSQVR